MCIVSKSKTIVKTYKPLYPTNSPISTELFSSISLDHRHFFFTDISTKGYYKVTTSGVENFKRLRYNRADILLQYIIIDCDNNDYQTIMKDPSLPIPNYIIANKGSVGGHLFFILDRPILKGKAFNYFKNRFFRLFDLLTKLYNGDVQNKGYIGKNYLNHKDFTHNVLSHHLWSLVALEKHFESHSITTKRVIEEAARTITSVSKEDEGGRNNGLFNALRKYAYKEIRLSTSDRYFIENVTLSADKLNSGYEKPLEAREVKDVVKSVVKYCLKRKRSLRAYKVQRGKMKLDKSIELKEKQKLGAEYTAKVKASKSELKLKVAILEMKSKGIKISVSSLSKYTSLSRPTVTKYKHLI